MKETKGNSRIDLDRTGTAVLDADLSKQTAQSNKSGKENLNNSVDGARFGG